MDATFLVTLALESADPIALQNEVEELKAALDSEFDVIDIKPWARPSMTLPITQTGLPPDSGNIT